MKPLCSIRTEGEVYEILAEASRTIFGEERTKQLETSLRAAGHHVFVLFRTPLYPRDAEPDRIDSSLEYGKSNK